MLLCWFCKSSIEPACHNCVLINPYRTLWIIIHSDHVVTFLNQSTWPSASLKARVLLKISFFSFSAIEMSCSTKIGWPLYTGDTSPMGTYAMKRCYCDLFAFVALCFVKWVVFVWQPSLEEAPIGAHSLSKSIYFLHVENHCKIDSCKAIYWELVPASGSTML